MRGTRIRRNDAVLNRRAVRPFHVAVFRRAGPALCLVFAQGEARGISISIVKWWQAQAETIDFSGMGVSYYTMT